MSFFSMIVVEYLVPIVLAIVFWFVGRKLIGLFTDFLEKRMEKRAIDDTLHSFLSPLARIGLQILLVLTIAATLGIETTSFAAIIGAASFAIGLAFQGSLANFSGGVLLLVFKPFVVGNYISVGSFSGTVKEIQVFYTVLQTPDRQKVIIPNSDLSNSSVTNFSAHDVRRANIKIPIAYTSNIKQAKQAISDVANNHPLVLQDPAPRIVVQEFGDDGIILSIRVWAETSEYWNMYFDFLELVKEAFDEVGVEIPYRQMDVYVRAENKS